MSRTVPGKAGITATEQNKDLLKHRGQVSV